MLERSEDWRPEYRLFAFSAYGPADVGLRRLTSTPISGDGPAL